MSSLALVSGATGGIGRCVAEALWYAGYSLIALGRTPYKVNRLQDWLTDHAHSGQIAHCLTMDLTQDTNYWRLHTIIQAHAKAGESLTLLAVCHGAAPAIVPALHAEPEMQTIFETDVIGAFRLAQCAGRYMTDQHHGSIVFMSSTHALGTFPKRTPYATSKAAICAMARALAVEWGAYNIRVNALVPWQVAGERSQRFIDQAAEDGKDLLEAYKRKAPLRRLVRPEDIASTVLWLAQNESVTGAAIVLDCGVGASLWHEGFEETSL